MMFVKNRTILINQQYAHLDSFIDELPSHFDKDGVLIRCERNTVKIFNNDSLAINVKEFCVPPIFYNRIVYRFLRLPKAVKAYRNAVRLKELGFETPEPIAYMLFTRGLMLSKCYFVSKQYSHAQSITDVEESELTPAVANVIEHLGQFTARLHELKIFHGDYGNGNILINYQDDKPIFSLIDINRMRFGSISMQRGAREFSRLDFTLAKFEILSKAYASARGFDSAEMLREILLHRQRFQDSRRLKREKLYKLKRFIIKTDR